MCVFPLPLPWHSSNDVTELGRWLAMDPDGAPGPVPLALVLTLKLAPPLKDADIELFPLGLYVQMEKSLMVWADAK